MKYFILIAGFTLSSFSWAMEHHHYEKMLASIATHSKGKPSITIHNNTQFSLFMEVGDLKKDNIRSGMNFRKGTQLTFSPYAHPFFLKEEYLSEGTTIKLTASTPEKKSEFNVHIGGNSYIKFGDTIRADYDGEKIIIEQSSTNPSQLRVKKTTRTIKLSRDKLPRRSNTFS